MMVGSRSAISQCVLCASDCFKCYDVCVCVCVCLCVQYNCCVDCVVIVVQAESLWTAFYSVSVTMCGSVIDELSEWCFFVLCVVCVHVIQLLCWPHTNHKTTNSHTHTQLMNDYCWPQNKTQLATITTPWALVRVCVRVCLRICAIQLWCQLRCDWTSKYNLSVVFGFVSVTGRLW